MPRYNYTLSGFIEVPEGSSLNERESAIVLPDGRRLRLWEALELETPGEDEHADISYEDAIAMNIFCDGDVCRFEVTE